MTKKLVFLPHIPVMLLLALLLVQPTSVLSQPGEHHHPSQQVQSGVGLEEHLGSKIPLNLVFRDENGRPVVLAELIKGPTIILPVYYSCSNVCNFLQGGLARVLPQLTARAGRDYQVLSISFDDSETPIQATRAKRMHLASINHPFPETGWRFLTGDSASIHSLTDAAGYHFQRRGRDFIHPAASLIVAGDGTIVRYLYGTSFLPKDLSLALLEAREGKVGATVAKVVEYCFSFDPAGKTYVFNLLRVSATVVILTAGSFLAFLVLGGRRRSKKQGKGKL